MSNWLSHPLDELSHLRHSIDDALKNWSAAPFSSNPSLDWGWKPRMDICENRGYFKILLELPGFQKEDLDVQVNGRYLSIKGSRQEYKNDEWKFHRRERYSGGEFHRAVALPEGIDANSIQAKFQGGVLTLSIPKTGGKSSQYINLMGKEEHFNKRNILDAEESERRRRMEDLDPRLSSGFYVAGRIGTVIDEERERQRRIDEIEHYYQRNSLESFRVSKLAEMKEKDRRIRDVRLEGEKKKNARKVASMIKQLGQNPKFKLRKTNFKKVHLNKFYPNTFVFSGFNDISSVSKLEERERQRRVSDKRSMQQQKALAKKVSNMIKNCRGSKNLQSNGLHHGHGQMRSHGGAHHLNIQSGHGHNNNNNYSYNDPYSFNFKVKSASKSLEEKERQRRIQNKQVQQHQKATAKKVSNMIKSSHISPSSLNKTYHNKNSYLTLEKERQRKLIDMIGKAAF